MANPLGIFDPGLNAAAFFDENVAARGVFDEDLVYQPGAALAGSVSGFASVIAAITTAILLSASALGAGTVSANLTTGIPLAGSIAAASGPITPSLVGTPATAVARDGSSGATLTIASVTVPAGVPNGMLLVGIAEYNCPNFSETTPVTVTYGGVAMTSSTVPHVGVGDTSGAFWEQGYYDSAGDWNALYYLLNPTAGTADVVIGCGAGGNIGAVAFVLRDVTQTGTFNGQGGIRVQYPVDCHIDLGSAIGELLVSVFDDWRNPSATPVTGQTLIANSDLNYADSDHAAMSYVAGTGSTVAVGWTWANTAIHSGPLYATRVVGTGAPAAVSGALSTGIQLAATVAGSTTVTGDLSTGGAAAALAGSLVGQATVTGDLTAGVSWALVSTNSTDSAAGSTTIAQTLSATKGDLLVGRRLWGYEHLEHRVSGDRAEHGTRRDRVVRQSVRHRNDYRHG
jgi:hypothetical protein